MRLILLMVAATAYGQPYDLLLRGGRVIDPSNGIDARRDVAVTGDRIVAIQAEIPPARARRVVEVTGFYVVPGLVDLHAHVFGYDGSLVPDETALPAGTTTIVDAGGSGWRTFDEFRRTVIATARTRVLALLNIVGKGMVGEPYESDVDDMDPVKTAETIVRNRDVIVGIKTAHFAKPGWAAIDRAVEAGRRSNTPVMVDDRIFTNAGRSTREELLEHLRPGDIHTHMYNDRQIELLDRFTGKVQPWMVEARRRGVLFDVGHGAGSFLWPVAAKAVEQGFMPDTISTDLHRGSRDMQQSDMPNVMSKMMLLGMPFAEVLVRSTVNPAKEIGRFPEIGTLGVGKIADIAVIEEQQGVFAYKDSWPAKRLGNTRLECVLTVRAGKVVYERPPEPPRADDTVIYDVLLKHARMDGREVDIGVAGSRIVRLGQRLPASHAKVLVEAEDYDIARAAGQTHPCGTATPATFSVGDTADIAVVDANKKCVFGLRAGRVVWDAVGLTIPDVSRAGAYSNFR